jgi:hypothetical protein
MDGNRTPTYKEGRNEAIKSFVQTETGTLTMVIVPSHGATQTRI